MRASSQGFTIIEVMIFLSVSGLLFLMVIIGTGTMASRQRFTDTTDSLQAFFQSQYNEVASGVNVRSASANCSTDGPTATQPGASAGCLLLGKLISINSPASTMTSQYVISTARLAGTETTDTQKLQAVSVQSISPNETVYELKWGAVVSRASRSTQPFPAGPGRGAVDSIAILRMPDSGRIVQFYYRNSIAGNKTQGLRHAILNDTNAFNPAGNTTTPSLAVCLKNNVDFSSAAPSSAIIFGQGEGSAVITTNYEPGAALCP